MTADTFQGYVRPDGTAGIRNHVVVIPTVACANGVASRIEKALPGVTALLHGHGCGRALEIGMHQAALAGLGKNPNVAGAVVIGLGCETVNAQVVASEIGATGKPVEVLMIQNEGGSRKTADKGIALAEKILRHAEALKRTECPLSKIMLGLECGGSDAFSGVTANPAVGLVSDWIVDAGGTVILTENTEMIGTAHILSRRASTPEIGSRITHIIDQAEKRTRDILGPLASLVIAPGNMDGGMSSIREKSLGCICKAGSRAIAGVVDYGQRPAVKGLMIMDGPGYDMESMAGLAAAGCQIMIFTTGRGNPAGFPIVPVLKVCSTSRVYRAMEDDMDVNAGEVLEGRALQDVADEIRVCALEIMNGGSARAEVNGQGGILCLYAFTPAF
jgi:altronate dehydratase large subunit